MIYNKKQCKMLPAPVNGLTPSEWQKLLQGDHDISANTFTTKEKMTYREALAAGAIEEIKYYVDVHNPDHFGRSAPFWGFYEYILWEELKIGMHVNDTHLIRKDVIDVWLESPKLWENYLKSGSSNEEFGIRHSTPFTISRDAIIHKAEGDPDGSRHKWLKLFFIFGDQIVHHIDTKSFDQIEKGGDFIRKYSYEPLGCDWKVCPPVFSYIIEEEDANELGHFRHRYKKDRFWSVGRA